MSFNKFDKNSIENYGKKLEGKSLKDLKIKSISKKSNKGGFNNIVQSEYFKIPINSEQAPDFSEAKIELKVAPLKEIRKNKESELLRERKGLSMKERTVLTMIDYEKLSKETWENNSLKEKAFKILFCFYIWKKETSELDYIFDLVSLWKPNKKDLEIIEQDWNIIVNKVKEGKAHEISEGDTLYLGACTKGSTAEKSLKNQPFSDIKAKSRAFSFKRSYMDMVYEELLRKNKETNLISIKKENETLENSLEKIFGHYIGKTAFELENELNIKIDLSKSNLPKNYYSIISNKILGVEFEKIEEFRKAGIMLKTIRVDKKGVPLESISFPTFKFLELIREKEWEKSELYNQLVELKYLFVVFEITTNKKSEFKKMSSLEQRKFLKLKKIKLWGIDAEGLNKMEALWKETKKIIEEGVKIERINNKNTNNLPGQSFNGVGHVRPHARDSKDTYPLPDGRKMVKQSFWLNAEYIKKELEK